MRPDPRLPNQQAAAVAADFVGTGQDVQVTAIDGTRGAAVVKPTKMDVDPLTGNLIVLNTCQTSSVIRSVTPEGVVTTIAGDPAGAGCFAAPPSGSSASPDVCLTVGRRSYCDLMGNRARFLSEPRPRVSTRTPS